MGSHDSAVVAQKLFAGFTEVPEGFVMEHASSRLSYMLVLVCAQRSSFVAQLSQAATSSHACISSGEVAHARSSS